MKKSFVLLLMTALLILMMVPAFAAADSTDDWPEICLQTRVVGLSSYFNEYTVARNGEVIEFDLSIVNHVKGDVVVQIVMPEALQYISGSAVLLGDRTFEDTLMTDTGLNLGVWGPDQMIEIRFRAKVSIDHDCIALLNSSLLSSARGSNNAYRLSLGVEVVPKPVPVPLEQLRITRLGFADMLVKKLADPQWTLPKDEVWPFSDCTSRSVAWTYAHGLMNGCGGGKFCPNTYLNREQLAVVLCRVAGIEPNAEKHNIQGDDISSWAGPSIAAIADFLDSVNYRPRGLDGDGNLCLFADDPKGEVARGFAEELLDIAVSFRFPTAVIGN